MTVETYGPLSVRELCWTIDLPLLALYPQLQAIDDEGLLQWDGETVAAAGDGARPKQ